jgi:hypothetical protein
MCRLLAAFLACALLGGLPGQLRSQEAQVVVQTTRLQQVFGRLGAGAVFYEEHITSLAECKNNKGQQLYDDMLSRVPTCRLQLLIRETHEPVNDNADPPTTPATAGTPCKSRRRL